MKKIVFSFLLITVIFLASCNWAEEEKKEKIKQDSLSKVDGDVAIDRANQLLSDTSLASKDTTKIKEEAKK
jgi:hypothetical protein